MTGQANKLPWVQYFYRDGMPLRAVVCREEVWFSVKDVFSQMGRPINKNSAIALLKAMEICCQAVPCADGAERLSLWCMAESDLLRLFDKMERAGA